MKYPKKAPFAALEAQLHRHDIEKQTVAIWMGISPSQVSQILRGHRVPKPVQAFNLRVLTRFLEARGITDPPRLPLYQPTPKRKSEDQEA